MIVELPLWGLIFITLGSFIIGFVIIKMIGTKILYSIAMAFVLPIILLLVLHSFDVKDGIVVPHVGDFYAAIFIAIGILYYVFLVLYVVVYITIRDRCCKKDKEFMEKVKLTYEGDVHSEDDGLIYSGVLPKVQESKPIDIIISTHDYDRRHMAGSLVESTLSEQ